MLDFTLREQLAPAPQPSRSDSSSTLQVIGVKEAALSLKSRIPGGGEKASTPPPLVLEGLELQQNFRTF